MDSIESEIAATPESPTVDPAMAAPKRRFRAAAMAVVHATILSRLFWTRLLSGVAFTASLMMTLDEHRSSPAFCRLNEGCDYVTASAFGKPGGVPLAYIGVAAFAALFALSLFPDWKDGRVLRAACLLAGAGGTALLLIQWLALHHFCPFCVAIDSCSIVLMLLHLRGSSPAWQLTGPRTRWVWTGLVVAAAAGCFGYNATTAAQLAPDYVRERWQPDKINVISITDFTCPYCRKIEQVFTAFENDDPAAAELHREIIVFPRQYTTSHLAAYAYFAAEDQGQGEAMAKKLFETEKLSLDICMAMAADLGLDTEKFRATVESEEMKERVMEHKKRVFAGGISGLPLTWVDNQQVLGWFSTAALKSAIVRAKRAKGG